ncbi:MAG: TonB family protein [bacterium]
MKIKWWYFPAALGGVIVVACTLIVFAFRFYPPLNEIARGWFIKNDGYDFIGEDEITVMWFGYPLKLRSGEWRYHYAQAEALRDQGRWEEALEAYDDVLVVEHPPSCLKDVYVGKARAFVGLGRWGDAVEAYGEAIKPELAGSCEDLCEKATDRFESEKYEVTVGGPLDLLRAVWDEGKYVDVLAYLKAAHELEPGHGYPYYMEGRVWLALGQHEKAVSYFDVVIKQAPDYAPAWGRKAWTLALMGRYEPALACADTALILDTDEPEAWNTKGKILLLTGEAAAARACFNRALVHPPYQAEALLGEGLTYFAEGNYDKARTYFEGLAAAYGSSYRLVYLYLTDRVERRPASDRHKPLRLAPPDRWPENVRYVLVDRISADDVMAEAEGRWDLAGYGSAPTITGTAAGDTLRSSAVITYVVTGHKRDLRRVYDKYRRNDSYLKGELVARFEIGASGAVTACSVVSSTLGNAAMEREVCDRVVTWRFPAVDAGDVTVVYPFKFYTALAPRD